MTKMKVVYKSGAVDLPQEQQTARPTDINLPEGKIRYKLNHLHKQDL